MVSSSREQTELTHLPPTLHESAY